MVGRSMWSLGLLACLGGAIVASGCSGNGATGTSSSSTGGPGGAGGAGGTSAGSFSTGTNGDLTLAVAPQDPVLDVTGTPKTLALVATLSDGTQPTNVSWEVDDVVVGLVDQQGVFTSQGLVAGDAKVTARFGMLSASTTVHVHVHIVDNVGNVSASDQGLLTAGGNADAAFRWLYPYDATVFPRGLRAPELHFAGAAADATYVKVSFGNFLYEGFFGASSPTRVALSQSAWKAISLSAGTSDAVQVSVSKLSGGQATGPATETWKIAQGTFKGSVYYNTYKSALTNTGAVMRVRPNVDASVFLGNCTVCHSVSAKGTVVAAGLNWGNGNPLQSGTIDIASNGMSSTRDTDPDGRKFAFGALTPDGDLLVSSAVPASGSPIRGLAGAYPTKLWNTQTGMEVADASLTGAITNALTPSFAPDGTKLAFNQFDTSQKTLGVMTVDLAQSPPAFGAPAAVATATRNVAAWPSFLPDAKGVVFHDGDAFDTSGYGGTPHYAELSLVDLATSMVSPLHALNGRDANGTTYLPYGESEEGNLDYEPTVLPIPVGGYYWVVFTSRRAYGNEIAPGGSVAGGGDKWGGIINGVETPSVRKKLWVAAIDIDYTGKADPSHPAFYLGEQELEAGNMRAFAALDPCKQDGDTCESGADCCGGFCRPNGMVDGMGNAILTCGPPNGGCSHTDEACTTAGDCCDTTQLCINGHCAVPPPPN